MTTSEEFENILDASENLYRRTALRDLTRDEKRLRDHYDTTIDAYLASIADETNAYLREKQRRKREQRNVNDNESTPPADDGGTGGDEVDRREGASRP